MKRNFIRLLAVSFLLLAGLGPAGLPAGAGRTGTTIAEGAGPWDWRAGGKFQDVHFADAQRGWIVGDGGLVLHTKDGGASWALQSSGTSAMLQAVSFVDHQRGWAVGGDGVILHTSDGGASWATQNSGVLSTLHGVHPADAMNAWATGAGGLILHTSDGGASWTAQTTGTVEELHAIHFVDGSRGWTVGGGGTILHTANGGGYWAVQTSGTMATLHDVHFVDAQNGWAAGTRWAGDPSGVILHTGDGGATWEVQWGQMWDKLQAIHFADTMNCWAVGADGDPNSPWSGLVLRTSDGGDSWEKDPVGSGDEELTGVHFVGSNLGWTTGSWGGVAHTSDGGLTWSLQASATGQQMAAVRFASPDLGWAIAQRPAEAGTRSLILHTDEGGDSWDVQWQAPWFLWAGPDAGIKLYGLSFPDPLNGWAVGYDSADENAAVILHTEDGGATWTAQVSGSDATLHAVHFVDSMRGWAAGSGGTILHTSDGGATWVPQVSGTDGTLTAVVSVDGSGVWAAGEFWEPVPGRWEGILLNSVDGGNTWTVQAISAEKPLHSVHAVAPNRGWAVGDGGAILSTDNSGAIWAPQASGSERQLHTVHFVSGAEGWAAGEAGIILHTINGGADWMLQENAVKVSLRSLHFVNRGSGWAVGDQGLILRYAASAPGRDGRHLALPYLPVEGPGPTKVVFDHYPDGTPVTTDTILNGDEFLALGIRLAAVPESHYCPNATSAAILVPPHHIGAVDFTFLTSSEPDRLACREVPVEISFEQDVRKVALVFAGTTGTHVMEVYDRSGSLLGAIYPPAVWGGGTFDAIYTSANRDIARVIFGRSGSTTIIKELRYW